MLQEIAEPLAKSSKKKDKYTILFVDDEVINLRLFSVAFRRDFNVITASSGAEALEVLDNNDVKLILTDQQMPGMLGTEFLEKTIEKYPDVIRMIVTGFADIDAIAQAVNKVGIYKYITKPWDNRELKLTMDKALETYELKNERNNLVKKLEEANQSLEQKVEERTKELTEANKRLTSSLTYAKTIQEAILPAEQEVVANFGDAFILYKPFEHVSGDFFWHAQLNDGRKELEILAVVDCVGHGVAGALLSMIGESLLDKIVNEKGIYRPDDILSNMEDGLLRMLGKTDKEGKETMDASIVVIDKKRNKLEFAGASQNLLYVKDGAIETIKGTRMSIGGVRAGEKDFEAEQLNLEGVQAIYMQSDGYRDQLSPQGKITIRRVKEILEKIYDKPMQQQKEYLDKFIMKWMDGEDQTDDITVVGIKI
jgi:sigma-B regulation protein RsbU (phosphoserine phosphatase)